MKSFLLSLVCLAAVGTASAGQLTLPEPSLSEITGNRYLGSETPNDIATTRGHQAITGWSQDGTQLYAATYGSWPYGYRGSRVASWCGTLTWAITFDSTGKLNAIAPATFTPGNCSAAFGNTGATFSNGNASATVVTEEDEFSPGTYLDIAELTTP